MAVDLKGFLNINTIQFQKQLSWDKGFRDHRIFQKCLYIIYNKTKSNKCTQPSGHALESWGSQLSNAYPMSSLA